jgi:hypothetical protein
MASGYDQFGWVGSGVPKVSGSRAMPG